MAQPSAGIWPFNCESYGNTNQNSIDIAYIIDMYDYPPLPQSQNRLYPQLQDFRLQKQDFDSLKRSLRKIGFHIMKRLYRKVTKAHLLSFMKSLLLTDFPDEIRSVLLYIKGHGNRLAILTCDEQAFQHTLYDDIIDVLCFNPSLNGKLKWFIFDSCHGNKEVNNPTNLNVTYEFFARPNNMIFPSSKSHLRHDVLVSHCALGYVSYCGYFQNILVDVCNEIEGHQVKQITIIEFLERINFKFAKTYSTEQMSEFSSNQIKEFQLRIIPDNVPEQIPDLFILKLYINNRCLTIVMKEYEPIVTLTQEDLDRSNLTLTAKTYLRKFPTVDDKETLQNLIARIKMCDNINDGSV
jgi:hypothetical protein